MENKPILGMEILKEEDQLAEGQQVEDEVDHMVEWAQATSLEEWVDT